MKSVDRDEGIEKNYAKTYLINDWRGQLTERRLRLSSLCRGITVTNSISHKKATSGGVSPGGSGSAIVVMNSGDDRGAKTRRGFETRSKERLLDPAEIQFVLFLEIIFS